MDVSRIIFFIVFAYNCKLVSTFCFSISFNNCVTHNNKKPSKNIGHQQQNASRTDCVLSCIAARDPRTVFYNDATMTCICTVEDVSSLGLVEDAEGICLEHAGYIETWMTSVLNVSSEYNAPADQRYLATRLLGSPVVYPGSGDRAGTWCPGAIDDNQWIEVGIAEALYIYHVFIYETHNPGALKTLSVRDTSNNWHVIWTSPQIVVIPGSRIFDPEFKSLKFKVDGFRLDIVMSVAGTWVQYDAIKVAGRK